MKTLTKQANQILRDDNKRLANHLTITNGLCSKQRTECSELVHQKQQTERRLAREETTKRLMIDSFMIERNDLITRIQRIDQRLKAFGVVVGEDSGPLFNGFANGVTEKR